MGTPAGFFTTQLSQLIVTDEQQRHERIERAWAAYFGWGGDTLTIKPGQPDDNVRLNKSRVIVDKGVSFLFGQPIILKLDEHASSEAQTYLDACLAANKVMSTLHKLALNGGVTGHVFLKIVPDGAGIDGSFPRLVVLDPSTVTPTWDPDDIEKVVKYVIQYNAVAPDTGKVMNYRQTVKPAGPGWVLIDEESRPDTLVWHVVNTTIWPHAYPPIVDCQNLPAPNRFWGISDIEDDVQGLNRAASFALSNAQRIIRYHAHPKTWGTGIGGEDINIDVDGVILLQNPDATLANLEMHSDLQSSIALFEKIEQAVHEVSRIPSIATGHTDKLGPLSGVALAILYQPLLEKTETKRVLYGDLLIELGRRLLDMAQFGPANVATITWPKLLPSDPLQERQADLLMDQMGVISKQTIAESLGLDWETEKQRMADEDATAIAKAQAMQPPADPNADPSRTLPSDPVLNARASNGMKPQGGQ